jgi:hypothetical protein
MHPLRSRKLIPWSIVAVVVAALCVALYFRAQAPPEAARLLPESDAIVYLQLKTLRSLTHFDQTPIARAPDFQRFIDATGIVPERDLDAVAFALHRMSDPDGPNGPVAYSEVFVGRFDGEKLATYLHSLATAEETYAGHTIYTIPTEHDRNGTRNLRIAQLAYDMVAASNMPTPEQIHSMLDRSRASALGTPGSSLLAARYHEVPKLPLPPVAWGIGRIGLPFASAPGPGGPEGKLAVMGMELPLPADTDLVASLGFGGPTHLLTGGAAHLRIEEIAPDEAAAHSTVEACTTLLALLRGVADAQPAHNDSDDAMRAILQSATLDQHGDRALLNASATADQLKALFAAHATADATPASMPASK